MTPLPKRRPSRARQGKRRSAIKLSQPTLVICSHCKSWKKPFTVCDKCGFYGDQEIFKPKAKTKTHEKPS